MHTYLFTGIVRPERAQLSLTFGLDFEHLISGLLAKASVSIVLNQVLVRVETENEWKIFDLRNFVSNLVQNQLQMVGFLKGRVYDLELTRVFDFLMNTDYVFGIKISCLADRTKDEELSEAINKLRNKTTGQNGILLNRCFSDLISAMKYPDDTGFYCYRAIESLRHHCAAIHALSDAGKSSQWEKFREIASCEEIAIREIKIFADPLRHGDCVLLTSVDRERLLTTTWAIVESYLNNS